MAFINVSDWLLSCSIPKTISKNESATLLELYSSILCTCFNKSSNISNVFTHFSPCCFFFIVQPLHQCDLKKIVREWNQPAMSFVATGRSLIQSGFPSFHAGVAYITSEIQWYSPLTGWSDPARLSAPVDIFLLEIIPIKCQTHSSPHDRVHCDLMSWPKESNDRKLWGYKKKNPHEFI